MPRLPQKTHRSNKAQGEPLGFCSLCGCLVEAYRLVRSEVQGLRGHWICDAHKFEAEARSKPSYQDQGGAGQAGGGVDTDDEINPGAGSWWPGPVTGAKVDEVWIEVLSDRAYEDGTQDGAIRVWRYAARSTPLTVYYSVGGTATAGVDYETLSGSIEIPVDYQFATIPIVAKDDAEAEGGETVIVTLTANALYTVGTPASGTVTIESDDAVPTLDWELSPTSLSVGQDCTVTITASSPVSADLDVNFVITNEYFYFGPLADNDPASYYSVSDTSPVTITSGSDTVTVTLSYFNEVPPYVEGTSRAIFDVVAGSGYIVGSPTPATSYVTFLRGSGS